jgi:hypothetical protein
VQHLKESKRCTNDAGEYRTDVSEEQKKIYRKGMGHIERLKCEVED